MKPRSDRSRIPHLIGVSTVITAAFYLTIYFNTQPWRIFSNDILPVFGLWELRNPHTWRMLILWFLPVFAMSLGNVVLINRGGVCRWLAPLVLIPAFLISRDIVIRSRLQNCTESCANHSAFWAPLDFTGDVSLTNSVEFDDFLMQMHGADKKSISLYCPGYKRVGTKTGIVFIGGGLDLRALSGKDVLLAFCSWKCHPPPYDHQHYLMWEWRNVNGEYRGVFEHECAVNTAAMVGFIQMAISQADRGIVPYSSDAKKLLRDELDQRKKIIGEMMSTQHAGGG